MNKPNWLSSWLDIIIVLAVVLIIFRFIWARELAAYESSLFHSLGVDERVKYFLPVPLAALVLWGHYQDSSRQVKGTGRKVIGRPVIAFALGSFIVIATSVALMGN